MAFCKWDRTFQVILLQSVLTCLSSSHSMDTIPPEVAQIAAKYSYSITDDRRLQKEVKELASHFNSL